MQVDAEIVLLPYARKDERGLLNILIEEFTGDRWSSFMSAVAFAKQSGNSPALLEAILHFSKHGGSVEMTFGADTFGAEGGVTEREAIETLLEQLGEQSNVELYIYHEKGRTFHPKLYLFSDEEDEAALLIVGSSNWSQGGLLNNVEANVIIKLDLAKKDHKACYDLVCGCFREYWQETE